MRWTVHLEGCPRRVNHAAVALNNDQFIYSFGGYSSGDNYTDRRPLDVHVLDTYTYRWQALPVPSSIYDEQYAHTPYQRYGHTVVSYKGSAFLWGGRNDTNGGCDVLYRYDPQQDAKKSWSKVQYKGTPPPKRDGHTSCIFGDRMIVFGGYEEEFQRFSNETYCLDFRNFQWSQINTTGFVPAWRDFHTATIIDGKMFVFGGRSDRMGQYLSNVEIYDERLWYLDLTDESFRWHVANLPKSDAYGFTIGPVGRRSHSAWCYNGDLYVFGGYNGQTKDHLNDLYKYCVATGKWVRLTPTGFGPEPRRRQCCVMVGSKVFLFGGTSPIPGLLYMDDDEAFERNLIDHSDMYVLDFEPKLKTLCLSSLIDRNLHKNSDIMELLPVNIRTELISMTAPNKITTPNKYSYSG